MEENTAHSVFDQLALEHPYFEYASTGQRFANFIIDVLVYYLVNIIVTVVIAYSMAVSGKDPDEIKQLFQNTLFTLGLALVTNIAIYTFMEGSTKGRSLGKLITQTKVVTLDMKPIGWWQAFTRTLCRIIPFEPFSIFSGSLWHDSMTDTMVIKKQKQFL